MAYHRIGRSVALALLFPGLLSAQITFIKTFGTINDEIGFSVEQTSDKGYIIVGSKGGNMANVWLIKTDALGNKLWDETFGGSDYDGGYSVKQTSDDGYIITGETRSYGSGYGDVWLLKTDGQGKKLWDKTFGGGDGDWGNSVEPTTDGGFIIAGYKNYGDSLWLIKTDGVGNKVWDKTFDCHYDIESDWGPSVQQTSDGGYITVGWKGYLWEPPYFDEVLLIKTDRQGNTVWKHELYSYNDDRGYFVRQTADGGYIITGRRIIFPSDSGNVLLMKADALGNRVWDKSFGGSGDDYGIAVEQTLDGGFIITGFTRSYGRGSSDAWLLKTDGLGNMLWNRNFGGSADDYSISVRQTTDGGYIVTGRTSSSGAGGSDVWLIKTDEAGNVGEVGGGETVKVKGETVILTAFPNPFSRATVISSQYRGTSSEGVNSEGNTLKIYDLTGRLVKSFYLIPHTSLLATGISWDGRDDADRMLPAGVYFIRLVGGSRTKTEPVILVR